MADTLEHFLNWQMDMDWSWGPFLSLRPPRNVRLTLRFWLKLVGLTVLFAAPIGAVLGFLLAYYDYSSAQRHETKIPPVVVTEGWMNSYPPQTVLLTCGLVLAAAFLSLIPFHWAWNRRADRLNREGPPMPEAVAAVPGVWPPPPTALTGNAPEP